MNLTEKVDFQQKLEEGLSQIAEVNVTESFNIVLDPLATIQSMLGSISDTSLSILNQAASSQEFPCAFSDKGYTKENILSPWSVDRSVPETPYIIRDNFGDPTSYNRSGIESAEDYMDRVYNIAGICTVSTDCCLYEDPMPSTCQSVQYAPCDFGASCAYPCSSVKNAIVEGYNAFLQLYDVELKMTADLGVECPNNDYDGSCPTEEFKSKFSNRTLVASIEDYKVKITSAKDDLVDLASTSVGDTMIEVEDFLCNMNISFVDVRYEELTDHICQRMFGGLSQIDIAFWIVGVSLEILAITCAILAIRLKRNYDESYDLDEYQQPVHLY